MLKSEAKRNIYKYIVFLVLSILFLMIIPESKSATTEWCRSIAIYLFVLFIFQVLSFRWVLGKQSHLLPIIFLLILYIFNFPQIILNGFNIDPSDETNPAKMLVNSSMITTSIHVAITSIVSLFLGMTIVYMVRSKDFVVTKILYVKEYSTYSILLIFIIGFAADIILNVVSVVLYGYSEDIVEGLPYMNLVRIFSLLLPSAVILSFTKTSYSIGAKRNILLLFVFYKFLCMMGGYRGFALINILLVLFSYYKLCSPFKIKLKHIIIGMIILVLGSGVMVGIRESRQTGVDIYMVVDAMFDFKNSAVLSLLYEFGGSINVINVVLNEIGENSHRGLLGSFIDIIPGTSSLGLSSAENSMDSELGLRFFGGNLIADLLYGYGRNLLFLSSFILGIIYAVFFELFERSLQKRNPFLLAYLFPILVDLFFCARSTITKMPREIVWYFLLLYFLTAISSRKKIKVRGPVKTIA